MGMPFLSAASYQNFNLLILIYVVMGKYFSYFVAKYKEIQGDSLRGMVNSAVFLDQPHF